MKINGETKIIGFFGSTYKTSKMYVMYNVAFKELNLNYVYVPFMVEDLQKAVEGIKHLGISAIGVTIPYKISIMKFLDEIDKNARRIGAVNVVINKNGKLIGKNTDGEGGVKALQEQTKIKGKKVLLLGAGGAARALAFAIKDNGGDLIILNRTIKDGKLLADAVGCRSDNFNKLSQHVKEADILINSTSVGMAPNENESLVPKELLRPDLVVQEIVSHPKETKLIKEAKRAKCKIVYADRMLLWQGVLKFKIYTGVLPPIHVMEKTFNNFI